MINQKLDSEVPSQLAISAVILLCMTLCSPVFGHRMQHCTMTLAEKIHNSDVIAAVDIVNVDEDLNGFRFARYSITELVYSKSEQIPKFIALSRPTGVGVQNIHPKRRYLVFLSLGRRVVSDDDDFEAGSVVDTDIYVSPVGGRCGVHQIENGLVLALDSLPSEENRSGAMSFRHTVQLIKSLLEAKRKVQGHPVRQAKLARSRR